MGTHARRSPDEDHVTVTKGEKHFVARDERTGVASQGETRADALANLAEALELHDRDVPPEDEPTEASDAPWF